MSSAPDGVAALFLMVLALGCKHGLDPDHLATIDGLTRFNAAQRPRLARWAGVLFSLGHGLVVMFATVAIAHWAGRWSPPAWVDAFGAWISIGVLFALAIVNLRAVLLAAPGEVVTPRGWRSGWLASLARVRHPVLILGVGALFAISFDTLSQAAVFSLAASRMAGWLLAALMGAVFMLGMMASDGVNGWWMSRLVRKADRRARIASRTMSLAIGLLGLFVGVLGLVREWRPAWLPEGEDLELRLGLGIIVLMLLAFALAMGLGANQALQGRKRS